MRPAIFVSTCRANTLFREKLQFSQALEQPDNTHEARVFHFSREIGLQN
jgi:hypothetical protein